MDRSRPRRSHEGGRGLQGLPVHMQISGGSNHDNLIHPTTKSILSLHPADKKEDLVKRWLAQAEDDTEPYERRNSAAEYKRKRPDISQSPQALVPPRPEASYQGEKRDFKSRRKRRYSSSSDSSLLEDALPIQLDPRTENEARVKPKNHGDSPLHQKRRSNVETPTSRQSTYSRETFEKRPRHKTREDLYEPKDQLKNSTSHVGERKRSTKRETKGEKRRAMRRAGEDLMNNFSSENIANDRLSLRPSNALGLFNNGRASSPQRQRGLPDLASSKMTFLQQPSRVPATKNQDQKVSKSHDKERRRAEREQLEISTFFQPQQTPMDETELHGREETALACVNEKESTRRQQKLRNHHEKDHTSLSRTDSLEPDDSRSHQHEKSLVQTRTPQVRSSPASLPNKKLGSSKATYVSWSDSHGSPIDMATSRYLRDSNQVQTSPIPDSIRRALEQTGIFKDTGIESTVAGIHSRETTPSGERAVLRELPSEVRNSRGSVMARDCAARPNKSSEPRGRLEESLDNHRSPSMSISRSTHQRKDYTCPLCAKHSSHKRDSRKERFSTLSNQAVLETSPPDFERCSDSSSVPPAPMETVQSSKSPLDPASPRLSREQLARRARIRHNPTSSAGPKVTEREKPQYKTKTCPRSPDISDNQARGSQLVLDPSAAPHKDTTAPDDASRGPRMEIECEVKDKVQQITYPEQPTITQNTSQTPVDPLKTTYLISDTMQKACVATDIPDDHSLISPTAAPNTTTNYLTSALHASEMYNRLIPGTFIEPLQPVLEAECPLPDLVRYQQMHTQAEGQTPFGDYHRYGVHGSHSEPEKNKITPHEYVARPGYWEQEYLMAPLVDENCIHDIPSGNGEMKEDYHRGQSPFYETVEERIQFPSLERSDPELWLAEGCAWPQDRLAEDIIPAGAPQMPYWGPADAAEGNENHDENEEALLGFWRPNRHY